MILGNLVLTGADRRVAEVIDTVIINTFFELKNSGILGKFLALREENTAQVYKQAVELVRSN